MRSKTHFNRRLILYVKLPVHRFHSSSNRIWRGRVWTPGSKNNHLASTGSWERALSQEQQVSHQQRERESKRAARGSKKCLSLVVLRRWTGAFLSLFFFSPPPTRLHSPRGLPTPEGVAVTPRSVCGLLSRHRQTHICANFLTADEATGGISQCHWRHRLQIHTRAANTQSSKDAACYFSHPQTYTFISQRFHFSI